MKSSLGDVITHVTTREAKKREPGNEVTFQYGFYAEAFHSTTGKCMVSLHEYESAVSFSI